MGQPLSDTGSQAELTAEVLCARYTARVYRFAAMVSTSSHDAEDLAQTALERAIRALPRFDPRRGGRRRHEHAHPPRSGQAACRAVARGEATMTDIETRLREMELRPPRDLEARALAAATTPLAKPGRRILPVVLVAVLTVVLAGYSALAFTNAPPAAAAAASGYGVGEGCWFVKDAGGLHFHVGGRYHGLPALCTSERRGSAPGR